MASVALSTKAVGSIVKLKVGGTPRDFIVVHHGKPSNIYDNSCNGTWLLMKDIYETRQWHSSNVNVLESSTIHSYLNSTFYNLFDANIRPQIKEAKIPYRKGGGSGGTTQQGANGLAAKIFLLSGPEVNLTNSYIDSGEGACLSYFSGTAQTGADNKRVANYNGSATVWWLRSPHTGDTHYVWYVNTNGGCNNNGANNTLGIRPALILPSTLLVSDDGSVSTNTAPSAPASITIPGSIKGGSTINISWSASSDAEGNLEGYVVERSTNGGTSWTQVYQGSSTSTTNTVPVGTTSVAYRVKAYDSEGLYSGYKTSSTVTVTNNTPPSEPSSITVPNTVKGDSSLTISWGAAVDAENNLSGYSLERQVDSGEWTVVFSGNALSYTDTITRGWATVAYRVRAYDSNNEYGGYQTAATRTIDNNEPPAISCDYESGADLGLKNSDFSITYSVSDADQDAVTVTEKVDGETKRTFNAELGEDATFELTGIDFMAVPNGNHTVTISANDGKETTTHTLSFRKEVTSLFITLEEAMEASEDISLCVLSVSGYIPLDAEYTVEVTNNANDDTPVWEDCTAEVRNGVNYVFRNHTAQNGPAFNFRITAARGPSNIGGNIVSIQGGFQ